MRRYVEHQLDAAHAELKEIHGSAWPADWRDFLRAWRAGGVSLREQSHQIGKLFGVDTCASTVRNVHNRLDND